jgi:hypothetical protein
MFESLQASYLPRMITQGLFAEAPTREIVHADEGQDMMDLLQWMPARSSSRSRLIQQGLAP